MPNLKAKGLKLKITRKSGKQKISSRIKILTVKRRSLLDSNQNKKVHPIIAEFNLRRSIALAEARSTKRANIRREKLATLKGKSRERFLKKDAEQFAKTVEKFRRGGFA